MEINGDLIVDNVKKPLNGAFEIVESGSNSNGYYIRFSDGTQIATHKYTCSGVSCREPWGYSYETALLDFGNWPAEFKTVYSCNSTITNGYSCWIESLGSTTGTHVGNGILCRPAEGYISTDILFLGVGTWK